MLSNQKQLTEKILQPFIKPLSGVNPNILTLLGSIPSLLFFVFLIFHWYLLAVIAFAGSIFDLIDGIIARKYHKVTTFGGFLDSTLDRIADFLFITAFAFAGIVRWEIVAPLLLFSFLTSYIRSRAGLAAKSHMEFAIGLIERPERLIMIIGTVFLYVLFPTITVGGYNIAEMVFVVLVILSAYTVLQRVMYAYKKL